MENRRTAESERRSLTRLCAIVLALVLSVGSSLTAQAQDPGKVARIGLLGLFTPELGSRGVSAVRAGLGELGWPEGRNIRLEQRYASGSRDQLRVLAAGLASQKVDVIVTFGTDATRAAKEATSSIPIVMGAVSDPVGSGFVASLARPGGNVTGLSQLQATLIGKQLQILKEVAPRTSRIGVITLGAIPGPSMNDVEAMAARQG